MNVLAVIVTKNSHELEINISFSNLIFQAIFLQICTSLLGKQNYYKLNKIWGENELHDDNLKGSVVCLNV